MAIFNSYGSLPGGNTSIHLLDHRGSCSPGSCTPLPAGSSCLKPREALEDLPFEWGRCDINIYIYGYPYVYIDVQECKPTMSPQL